MAARKSQPDSARARALDLLARREHSVAELRAKLTARELDPHEIDAALARLAEQGLVSDERYVEAFVSAHRRRGHGPNRIRAELRQKGVPGELIDRHLAASLTEWTELARQVRVKRFGPAPPKEFAERARQTRFLEMRGFPGDAIRAALGVDDP
jgi:regulatory protein